MKTCCHKLQTCGGIYDRTFENLLLLDVTFKFVRDLVFLKLVLADFSIWLLSIFGGGFIEPIDDKF